MATRLENLWIAPAGERMAVVDLHLASAFGRERVFARSLECPAVASMDVVVVDTARPAAAHEEPHEGHRGGQAVIALAALRRRLRRTPR